MSSEKLHFDALVVGGGIAGLQTAIDLGDQGYQVALVEKKASIGGKMIMLSKVFPTWYWKCLLENGHTWLTGPLPSTFRP